MDYLELLKNIISSQKASGMPSAPVVAPVSTPPAGDLSYGDLFLRTPADPNKAAAAESFRQATSQDLSGNPIITAPNPPMPAPMSITQPEQPVEPSPVIPKAERKPASIEKPKEEISKPVEPQQNMASKALGETDDEKLTRELSEAQASRDDLNRMAMLLKGSTDIGVAIATRGEKTAKELGLGDTSGIEKMAQQKVADIEEKRKALDYATKRKVELAQLQKLQQGMDPNSPVAKVLNQYIATIDPKVSKLIEDNKLDPETAMKLLDEVRKTQAAKEETASRKEAALARLQQAKEAADMRQAMFGERMKNKQQNDLKNVQEAYNKDKQVQDLTTQRDSALNAEQLLNAKGPVSDAAIGSSLAKLSGERGVLTDRDVERFGGSQAIASKISRASKRMVTGTLPDQDRKEMMDLVHIFKLRTEQSLQQKAVLRAKQAAKTYGMSPEEAYDYLRPGEQMPSGMVRMRTPDGQLHDVPQANVEAAKKRGAIEVQ